MDTLELIRNIRNGQDVCPCLEELYAKVRKLMLQRIDQKIHGKLQARLDAEDVVHEAFLRAMEALNLFRGTTAKSFYGWVYAIAKNLVKDQAKRRSLDAVHLLQSGKRGPRASRIRASEPRPESLFLRRDQIESLLKRLKDDEAELIRLHRLEGLSFAEIAERTGKTPAAVQRSFSRSWRKLCDRVGE